MTKLHRKRLALGLETIQPLQLDRVSGGGGVGEHPTSRETLDTLPTQSGQLTRCISATCPR